MGLFAVRDTEALTILSGASLSGASPQAPGTTVVGIVSPAAWTAASATFQVSYDGGTTYADLWDEGSEYTVSSITTAASRYHALDPRLFLGATNVKVRSGTAASAVNQGADRIVTVIFRGLA